MLSERIAEPLIQCMTLRHVKLVCCHLRSTRCEGLRFTWIWYNLPVEVHRRTVAKRRYLDRYHSRNQGDPVTFQDLLGKWQTR